MVTLLEGGAYLADNEVIAGTPEAPAKIAAKIAAIK